MCSICGIISWKGRKMVILSKKDILDPTCLIPVQNLSLQMSRHCQQLERRLAPLAGCLLFPGVEQIQYPLFETAPSFSIGFRRGQSRSVRCTRAHFPPKFFFSETPSSHTKLNAKLLPRYCITIPFRTIVLTPF